LVGYMGIVFLTFLVVWGLDSSFHVQIKVSIRRGFI
jgi:hypothetical protein